ACTTTVSVASGGSSTFTFTVDALPVATDGQTLTNSTTVTADPAVTDPVPGNNSDTDVTTVPLVADLSITKDDGVTTYTAGDVLIYSIVVSNTGPSDVTGATVLDAFTADITSATWACAVTGAATCTASGSGNIIDTIDIAVGETVTYTVTATTSGAATSDPLINVATVNVPVGTVDPTPANNTDDDQDTLLATGTIDLAVTIVDSNDPIPQGGFLTYTVVVTNVGTNTATNVQLVGVLDSNEILYLTTAAGCTESPVGTLTCPLGSIAAGGSTSFDIIVAVDPAAPTGGGPTGATCGSGEDLCSLVSVSATEVDSNLANNSSEEPTDVIVPSTNTALEIQKMQLTPDPILQGGTVNYRLVLTNSGPGTATDVVAYDGFDVNLTHVSNTGGCTLVNSNLLECPIGTMLALTSVQVDFEFTVSLTAPTGDSGQVGDCVNAEDICNAGFVFTSSADSAIVDNSDLEPTDVVAIVTCGNGVLDPGEQCDAPGLEICNNLIDDDGDLNVDCADPKCAVPDYQSCTAACQLVQPCVAILDDPAKIFVDADEEEFQKRTGKRKSYVAIHGRLIPETTVDPKVEGFTFTLTNANGLIYTADLYPGDMLPKTNRPKTMWKFKDPSAKFAGYGIRGGIFKVSIKHRRDSYTFSVRCYGDMSRATLRRMTTMVYIGDDVAFLTTDWSGKPGRWILRKSDFK
ncbi:MAG: putative repeat protein (TIGR01451 family), partial [Candidatus Binatia bacterium]